MNPMRVIGLDIETSNLDMDADGLSFGDPTGWTTSCVSIYDHHRDATFHYVADPDSLNLSDDSIQCVPILVFGSRFRRVVLLGLSLDYQERHRF